MSSFDWTAVNLTPDVDLNLVAKIFAKQAEDLPEVSAHISRLKEFPPGMLDQMT